MRKIVITGGHLTPALAVIDELRKKGDWEIHFFGRKYAAEHEKTLSAEYRVIIDQGIWFYPLMAGRFFHHFNRYALKSFLRIPLGFLQAFYYLLKIRPQAILSFGGYVSVPVVILGWFLKIPSLTHEQTTVQGLATKVNRFFVKKIAVSWPETERFFPQKKVVLTGNPIRKEIFKIKEKYWRVLNFSKNLPFVFITGGNQGSHILNQTIKEVLPQLLKSANVFHQCGHLESLGDFELLEKAWKKLPSRLQERYHVKKYLTGEEMGTFLNKADLVVSRSGINTLTEIAALGKPALFIPHPWIPGDEQTRNAEMMVKQGVAEILPQKKLSAESLCQKVKTMLGNLKNYQKNAISAKKTVKLDAARRIVQEIENLA